MGTTGTRWLCMSDFKIMDSSNMQKPHYESQYWVQHTSNNPILGLLTPSNLALCHLKHKCFTLVAKAVIGGQNLEYSKKDATIQFTSQLRSYYKLKYLTIAIYQTLSRHLTPREADIWSRCESTIQITVYSLISIVYLYHEDESSGLFRLQIQSD